MKAETFHLNLDDHVLDNFNQIMDSMGVSKREFLSAFITRFVDDYNKKIKLNIVDVVKESIKERQKKNLTRSFYDQFLFRNATRTIINICMWQKFQRSKINLNQVKMNINKALDIYENLPTDLKLMMKEERDEFTRLQDISVIEKKLLPFQRLSMVTKRK